uniref:Uncharacterized protein n=1 Tax=Glossina pallidipes TaxID=7398 RepID=A0A1B0AHX1_GLOPL
MDEDMQNLMYIGFGFISGSFEIITSTHTEHCCFSFITSSVIPTLGILSILSRGKGGGSENSILFKNCITMVSKPSRSESLSIETICEPPIADIPRLNIDNKFDRALSKRKPGRACASSLALFSKLPVIVTKLPAVVSTRSLPASTNIGKLRPLPEPNDAANSFTNISISNDIDCSTCPCPASFAETLGVGDGNSSIKPPAHIGHVKSKFHDFKSFNKTTICLATTAKSANLDPTNLGGKLKTKTNVRRARTHTSDSKIGIKQSQAMSI